MFVVVNFAGGINWDDTRLALRSFIFDGQTNYGPGNENAIRCPGCLRMLPTATCSLDHIRPQDRFTMTNMGTGAIVIPLTPQLKADDDHIIVATGGTVSIHKLGPVPPTSRPSLSRRASGQRPVLKTQMVQTAELWRNMLENLQLVCCSCNSMKGNQTWEEWKGTPAGARPVTAVKNLPLP